MKKRTLMLGMLFSRLSLGAPLFIPVAPPSSDTIVGEYRGRDITLSGPAGVDVPLPVMSSSARTLPRRERIEYNYLLEHKRLLSALRSAIVGHWLEQLGVGVDLSSVDDEKRRALKELVGKGSFDREDLKHTVYAEGVHVFPMPAFIELLRVYVKDAAAAERAYEQRYADQIRKEDWVKCKSLCPTPEALRDYTERVYVHLINRLAEIFAQRRLREAALAQVLVAKKQFGSPDEFRIWLQAELKHVRLHRVDPLALFVTQATITAPLLDPLYCREMARRAPGVTADSPTKRKGAERPQEQGHIRAKPRGPRGPSVTGWGAPHVLAVGLAFALGLLIGVLVRRVRGVGNPVRN